MDKKAVLAAVATMIENCEIAEDEPERHSPSFSSENYRVREWRLHHMFGSTSPVGLSEVDAVYFRGNQFMAAALAMKYLTSLGYHVNYEDEFLHFLTGDNLVKYLLVSPMGAGLGLSERVVPVLYEG